MKKGSGMKDQKDENEKDEGGKRKKSLLIKMIKFLTSSLILHPSFTPYPSSFSSVVFLPHPFTSW